MRGIGKGQTIILFVIPEVARLCAAESALGAGCTADALRARLAALPVGERSRVELESIAGWLMVNSMKSERVQFELWCLHCAQNVWRKRGLRGLAGAHAAFSDAREGRGASAAERRMLEVFRERVERDVSNSVPERIDARRAISNGADVYAELVVEPAEKAAIASVGGRAPLP